MTRVTTDRLSPHHQVAVRRQLEDSEEPREPKPKLTLYGIDFDSRLELDYAFVLEARKRYGAILDWRYHPMRFRIAPGKTYEPDFLALSVSTCDWAAAITIYEVKGSWDSKNARDSRIRLEVAASLNYWFRWVAVTRDKGVWNYETI